MKLARRLFAEGLGSMLLAATVVGSGIMAERLASGDHAVALLANTAATVSVLGVLIATLAPISGAHFNPAVSLTQAFRGVLEPGTALAYLGTQFVGCTLGALLAHAMFEMPLLQSATHIRAGSAQWLSEVIATAGLLLVVIGCASAREAAFRVPAWIGAAYWFTASTSFANPAITLARSLTDSFSGIRPVDAPMFMVSQLIGAVVGLGCAQIFFPRSQVKPT